MALTDIQKLVRGWCRGYYNANDGHIEILKQTTTENLDTVVAELTDDSIQKFRDRLIGYPERDSDWKGWRIMHLHGEHPDPDGEAARIRKGVELFRDYFDSVEPS